jgi:hypothetical protein
MCAAEGAMMNFTNILTELKSERDRIEHAIAAIEGLNSTGVRLIRRAARATSRMNAAARARMSQLMKQRWAQGKMGTRASVKPAVKSKRRISAAGRKRIIEATKRRWAEWRRMQKKPVAKARKSRTRLAPQIIKAP